MAIVRDFLVESSVYMTSHMLFFNAGCSRLGRPGSISLPFLPYMEITIVFTDFKVI